jgi:hypothetical protein
MSQHRIVRRRRHRNCADLREQAALDGFNGTIFAYGQTGSGKTFSITGGTDCYADRGIIPRALSMLFNEFKRRSDFSYQAARPNPPCTLPTVIPAPSPPAGGPAGLLRRKPPAHGGGGLRSAGDIAAEATLRRRLLAAPYAAAVPHAA